MSYYTTAKHITVLLPLALHQPRQKERKNLHYFAPQYYLTALSTALKHIYLKFLMTFLSKTVRKRGKSVEVGLSTAVFRDKTSDNSCDILNIQETSMERRAIIRCFLICDWQTSRTSGVPRGGFNPPEIPKFCQSWAEFPVPWNIQVHPNNLIRIWVSLICKLSGTPD
jgi:hypothetical protein